MSDVAPRVLVDASPAVGVGLVPRVHASSIIVLMVDDSDDDELASVLASREGVPADGFDGAWSAKVRGELLTIEFHLAAHDDGWERRWTHVDPGGGILNAISARAHHVAIVPAFGDLSEFVRQGQGGAIIVDTHASGAVAAARSLLEAGTIR